MHGAKILFTSVQGVKQIIHFICALKNMQLNCRILDSRLIYHDEDTLTGSECVVGEDTVTV